MTGVVRATCVGDADDGTLKRRVGETRAFNKRLAQEQGETTVAIIGQALGHPFAACSGIKRVAFGFFVLIV